MPEYNLPKNLYSQFKWHILNLPGITNIHQSYARFTTLKDRYGNFNDDYHFLYPIIDTNYRAAVATTHTRHISLLLANYLDTIKDGSRKSVFPLQKSVALFMAHTRFTTRKEGFISNRQCLEFIELAQPGDIILERGEWRMTNLGIPGF
ncbi:MAG: hypothetical protein ACP5FZ_02075 [Fidelibacterota bacterium]